MNYTNNSPRRLGIVNGNGYSNHPPTIIETAFSVAINGPPPLCPSLSLPFSVSTRPTESGPRRAPLFLFSISRAGRANLWFGNSAETMRTGRCAGGGVGEGGDIWVTRRRGASYKLNLCNYGSNYAGIRAITCAPTVPDTLVPSLRLLPSLLMNDSVGLRLVETCRSDRLNRDTAFSFYGVRFDRRPMDSWFHFGNRITGNGYNLSLRHVIIVIRLRIDSYCLSSSRISNV